MLSFSVYSDGQPAKKLNLTGSYLVGSDDVPLRAEISFRDGIITCTKRAAGPAGLALLWPVRGVGSILLETIRVPERDKPYTLQVELVRARLARLNQKLEDWGLLDFEGTEEIVERINKARKMLIRALQAETVEESAALGDEALVMAIKASEESTGYHAAAMLQRRMQAGVFSQRVLGCAVTLAKPTEPLRKRLKAVADFTTVPIVWRDLEPSEQTFNWKPLDAWVEYLAKHHMPIKGSALLRFSETHVPDWLYIWEHDFDTIRDLAFEYVRRVLNRYGHYVLTWDVISGIHANNCFTFSFEQLMELTRMTAGLVKQMSPRSVGIIELVAPWGEYYARNQRTIPPLLYADMVVQSGVNFDAFGLQFYFGPSVDGMHVRDMFQISSLIDLFGKLGKPIHISAVQVPSDSVVSENGSTVTDGFWREPWSEALQSQWLTEFLDIALSKPFIETVSWSSLTDHTGQIVPSGGLLSADLTPKPVYKLMVKRRKELLELTSTGVRSSSG